VKQHFIFLDGLRGFAALAIAFLHASKTFHLAIHPGHAYLAVDFFFCLSGFVISYAYDDRLRGDLVLTDFFLRRLIRLYPMIFIGTILGFAAAILQQQLSGTHEFTQDGMLLAATLFLIPLGIFFHQMAYPLNNPIWSLFFELFANVIYGLQQKLYRFPSIVEKTCLFFFGVILLGLTIHGHTIELVGFNSKESFLAGFIRVLYPFFMGVIIYRSKLFLHLYKVPSLIILSLLLAALLLPAFPHSWMYDSFFLLLGFPLIIAFGANPKDFKKLTPLWKVFGALSFPLYVVHQPILQIFYLMSEKSGFQNAPIYYAILGVLTSIAVAYAFLILYDQPFRNFLSKTWRARAKSIYAKPELKRAA
jgi:peptidoglycan/LPS O-acetylase OafA/YrhL